MRPFSTLAAAAILAICVTGCDELTIDTDDQTECIDGQCKPKLDSQSPAKWDADLPYELRMKNWGGGSCVHASTIDALEWTGQHEMAVYWRQAYIGGESLSGLVAKAEKNNLAYAYTGSGDAAFLDWASRTRRWATIFFKPNHSINFCGWAENGDAILLDNNATKDYERVPHDRFISAWKGYGGVAWVPVYSPTPPTMWAN